MDLSWSSLKLSVSPTLLKGIETLGFKDMTPIQAACIPKMLNYKDVVAEAVTGSGKTVAFILPLLQIMIRREEKWKKHQIGGIVIAPTRELAMQIDGVLSQFLLNVPELSHLLFIGGTSVEEDLDNFKENGGNVIIATPGRFQDLLLRVEGSLLKSALRYLEVLILDEADCLLNMGFEKIINSILQMLPKQRRTGLFSATQTTELRKLIRAGLRNPVSIVVTDKSQIGKVPSTLENYFAIVQPHLKFQCLLDFIKAESSKKILIFFSTCACTDYFGYILSKLLKNISVSSLHGKMKEKGRLAVFDKFRDSESGILCCTDVMARGIDITKKIHWVIQFDPPSHPASFIHRSGRTGRNGEEGKAILLLQPLENEYAKFLEINQKVEILLTTLKEDSEKLTETINRIQKLQLEDKAVYDKSVRAFVSYYKAYSKYDCNQILRVKDLELGQIARCYGLLKFPKMSELNGKKPTDFSEVEVDINSLPYKDKLKEASRKRKMNEFEETGKWPESTKHRKIMKDDTSWSKAKLKRSKKLSKSAAKKDKSNSKILTLNEISAMEKAFLK